MESGIHGVAWMVPRREAATFSKCLSIDSAMSRVYSAISRECLLTSFGIEESYHMVS